MDCWRDIMIIMKTLYATLLFLLLSGGLFAQQPVASAPRKYALIIGNADYQRIEKLNNTVNDARDIGAALQGLGYQVDLRIDLSQYQMIDAVDAFVARLSSDRASEGFFWYAGHAVQIRDENFLLPVDVTIDSESRVRAGAFSLNTLLSTIDGARNRVNVIVLDSCRDNPLPTGARGTGARGLTVVNDLPADLFIMFSTAPGNKAEDGARGKRNSPFAEAFLKNVKSTEPLTIMAAHVANETLQLTNQRQRPFYRGSIISDVYYSLNAAPVAQATPAVQPAPMPAPQPAPQQPEWVKPAPTPQPEQPDLLRPEKKPKEPTPPNRLSSIGVAMGSTFAAPFLLATLQGTFAPARNSFFELGIDFGFLSGVTDVSYFSVYPFLHYALFVPIAEKHGWYAGLGGGFMYAAYTFPEGEASDYTFAFDVTTGFVIGRVFTISYTLRTNFSSANNKVAIGLIYRF